MANKNQHNLDLIPLENGEKELSINEQVSDISESEELVLRKSYSAAAAILAPRQTMQTSEHKALSAFLFELQSYQSTLFKTTEEFHRALGNNTLVLRIPLHRWNILIAGEKSHNTDHKRETLKKLSHKQFVWDNLKEGEGAEFEYENLFLSTGIVDHHVVLRIPPRTRRELMIKSTESSFNLNILTMSREFKYKYQYPLYELLCQYVDVANAEEKQVAEFSITQDELLMRLRVPYTSKLVRGRIQPQFQVAYKTPAKIKEKIITPTIKRLNEKRETFGMDISVNHSKRGDRSVIYHFNVIYTPKGVKADNSMMARYSDEVVFIKDCFYKYPVNSAQREKIEAKISADEKELLYVYDCWTRATGKKGVRSRAGYFLKCYKENRNHFDEAYAAIIEQRERKLNERRKKEEKSIEDQKKEHLKELKEKEVMASIQRIQQSPEQREEMLTQFLELVNDKHKMLLKFIDLKGSIEEVEESILNSPPVRGIFKDFIWDRFCDVSTAELESRVEGAEIEARVEDDSSDDIQLFPE